MDEPQKVVPKIKRSFAQWAITILVGLFLLIVKGCLDHDVGFKYGGGAFGATLTNSTIIAIASTIFYSPLFKSNIDKKNFKVGLLFSIILLFISYLMYSGVFELKSSKINNFEEPIDRIHRIAEDLSKKSEPLPKEDINIDKEISDIDNNIQELQRKIPPKNADENNGGDDPAVKFDLELPKRRAFFHKWEVAEFENSIDLSYPYEPFSELRFKFFKDNHLEVNLLINKFPNIPTKGIGTFNIDGVHYPIGYEISEIFKDIGTSFKIIIPDKSLVDIFNDMRAGRSLTLNFNSSRIKEKFNLQGLTAATNQIKKWFNY